MLKSASKIITQTKVFGNLQKFSDAKFIDATLTNINKINHDSYIYKCRLPDPNLPLGLETGHHVVIHAELPTKEAPQGEIVSRYFTPISNVNEKGNFDLLVKIYRRGVHPNYPDGGVLTQYLETLKVEDKIKISAGRWRIPYHGYGQTTHMTQENVQQEVKSKRIGMICGGTGIAPMYQIIRAILENPEDKTEVSLLFANKTEDDILLRRELDAYATDPRFKVYHTLDMASPGWKGLNGFVTPEMIQKTMPAPKDDTSIFICGSFPMIYMLIGQLKGLGYREDLIL